MAKVGKKQLTPNFPVKYAAFKFSRYINSCTNKAHLMTADGLIFIFKIRFPDELVETTKLQNALQLRRIEIDYLQAVNSERCQ